MGVGGTNAHVILEEAPPQPRSASAREWHLLPLSARNETALAEATSTLATHLDAQPDLCLADVAHTLQNGRHPFAKRRTVVCRTTPEAVSLLRTPKASFVKAGKAAEGSRTTVFMFPGQGSQHVNMGLGLYRSEPVFRSALDVCLETLKGIWEWSSVTSCTLRLARRRRPGRCCARRT